MSRYEQKKPSGNYATFDSDGGNAYNYWIIEDLCTTANVIMVAEREVPDSSVKELCVVKETGLITGTMFKKTSSVEVKLGDYLQQLSLVDHGHLTKFYGHGRTPSGAGKFKLNLICEYCPGGDLQAYLNRCPDQLPVVQILAYSKQILDGLCHLHHLKDTVQHAKNIIHCDIKPENLFLCDYRQGVGYMTIKIGDYDDPVLMERDKTAHDDVKFLRGTFPYTSPEMCKKSRLPDAVQVGRKTDTWSTGCVILKMCLGRAEMRFAYGDEHRTESAFVSNPEYEEFVARGATPQVPPEVSDEISRLLKKCLIYDEQQRLFASEISSLFHQELTSALTHFRSAQPVVIQQKLDRPYKSDRRSLNIPEHYWYDDIIMLQSKRIDYDCEWLYAAHKFQRVGFDGLITVVCRDKWFYTLPYFKQYIMRLDFRGIEHYSMNHDKIFSHTTFSNLFSVQTDECCVITKDDIEALFSAAPSLCEILMNGSKLKPWVSSTLAGMPASFHHIEYRLPRKYSPEDVEALHAMDTNADFSSLRTFFQENHALVADKNETSVSPQLYVVYGLPDYVRPTKDPRLLRPNFFSMLGQGLIFEDRSLTLRPGMLAPNSCCCPLVYKSCTLTACVKDHSYFAVTIAGDASADDWTEFWRQIEEQHQGYGFPRPAVKLTLNGCSWKKPLQVDDMVVAELTIHNLSTVSSRQWLHWCFSDVRQLIFRNCRKVSLYIEDLPRTFPSLRSIVMDNSMFGVVEENVFAELPNLSHLCLDGASLFELVWKATFEGLVIDPEVEAHLILLHFDKKFSWLREYLRREKHLLLDKCMGSIYEMGGDIRSPPYLRAENFLELDKETFRSSRRIRIGTSRQRIHSFEERNDTLNSLRYNS